MTEVRLSSRLWEDQGRLARKHLCYVQVVTGRKVGGGSGEKKEQVEVEQEGATL